MPLSTFARLNVITSVGFEAAYNELDPVFQKSSGDYSFDTALRLARQWTRYHCGTTPRGAADAVIMSKEGLGELLAEGRIISASAVDLAQARLGVAVRAGTAKPDISTVEAFRHVLLRSKSINAVSTTGLHLSRDTELRKRCIHCFRFFRMFFGHC
jgi:molybdate transport system substrate-binding protein